MMHCPSAKQDSDYHVEVGFEQMDYTEFVKLNASPFFIYHHVNDLLPAL
jgi:hypothetical protein